MAAGLVLAMVASLMGPALADTRGGGNERGEPSPLVTRPTTPTTVPSLPPLGSPIGGPVRGEGPPLRGGADDVVQLELVEGVQDLEGYPELVAAEVDPVDPPPDPGQNLSGNEFGCLMNCLQKALLHKNPFNPNIDLEVNTNVQTTKTLWVLPPTPFIMNGMPVHLGQPPREIAPASHDYTFDIDGLAHGSSYRVVLWVLDNQGNGKLATTIFSTTPEPVQNLAGNGSGCYYDCIESGTVTLGDSFDEATIEIVANTDVTFDVAVSSQAPYEINGNPTLANTVNMNVISQTSDSLEGQLTGLSGDTEYHVVVGATDGNGFTHYAVGSFTTDEEPPAGPVYDNITVVFEKFHVLENGDDHFNGEIKFLMGIGPDGQYTYWETAEMKMADDSTHSPGYESVIQVEQGHAMPDIIVNARERDVQFPSAINTCGAGQTLFTSDIQPGCADGSLTYKTAVLQNPTAEWINGLADCGEQVPGNRADHKCYWLGAGAGPVDDDYVNFNTLISFKVN
jgi:hypothetical protein